MGTAEICRRLRRMSQMRHLFNPEMQLTDSYRDALTTAATIIARQAKLLDKVTTALTLPMDTTHVADTADGRALWGAHQAWTARQLLHTTEGTE